MTDNTLYFKVNSGARTREQICALIAQIDLIIDSLLNTALVSVGKGDTEYYEIDTGQTKHRVQYTDADQITEAIREYEKIRQIYQNKLNPRMVRLRDQSNFRLKL